MNGQVSPPGGPPLATHSGSIVSPYLIGTDGWALFVHRPSGEFDLRAERARLIPRKDTAGREPLEVFVVALQEPADAVAGYYRLTGKPVLPLDPVRQYAAQPADGPTTIRVYPGRDGESRLYEDDGESPEYARGKFTRTRLKWDEGPPAGDRAGRGGRVPGRGADVRRRGRGRREAAGGEVRREAGGGSLLTPGGDGPWSGASS